MSILLYTSSTECHFTYSFIYLFVCFNCMLFFPMQQKKISLKHLPNTACELTWTYTDHHMLVWMQPLTFLWEKQWYCCKFFCGWFPQEQGNVPVQSQDWGKHFEFSFHKSTIGNFHSLPLSVYTIKEPLPRLHAVAHSKSAGMFPIPIPTQSIGHGSSFTGMKTRMYFTCKSRHLGVSISYFPGNTLKYIDLM